MASQNTIPEYVPLNEYVSLLKKQGITKENRFIATIPCTPYFRVVCLRSIFCPPEKTETPMDVVSIYWEGNSFGRGGWKKCREPLFHVPEMPFGSNIDCFGALLDTLDTLVKANANAAVVFNGYAVVRESGEVCLPRIARSKPAPHSSLELSFSKDGDKLVLLQSSTFNLRLVKLQKLKTLCQEINKLPSIDPEHRIQYAKERYQAGEFLAIDGSLFFVGSECFTDMQTIKKRWPNQSMLPESLGSDPMALTFIQCYPGESHISIKRCILTPAQLKEMEPKDATSFKDVKNQVDKELNRERDFENIQAQISEYYSHPICPTFTRSEIMKMIDEDYNTNGHNMTLGDIIQKLTKRRQEKDDSRVLFTMPAMN